MSSQSSVPLVSRRRAVLTVCMAVLMLAFNYGSLVRTVADAAGAMAVFLVVGYLTLTAMDLLFDRFLWRN
ncbi:hypothetical protein [Haloterrigena salifodinae]|uniref:hypothetical protein n=1 Tax=Haloterrigena salifodinae TaxID=2675099 RepID=UPI000F87FD83|nr:hypothetical protein [Haloterrigena salifodinae]